MCTFQIKTEDVEPLLEGLSILGTGGGGNIEMGKAILEKELADGRGLWVVDPNRINDDSLVVSGGIMGSVKTMENVSIDEQIARWDRYFELLQSARLMEDHLGQNIDYLVPFEVGGENTPVIMALASRMGLQTIDGDGVGRSAPETHMANFLAQGVSLTPMALTDIAGNSIIVTGQKKPVFADKIGRWMITRGGGTGANIHYPMSGKILKQVVIPNTISLSLEIGRQLIKARQNGSNPIQVVTGLLNGYFLFEGVIDFIEDEDVEGFYIANVELKGKGAYKERRARIAIKNETMALWIDDVLRVTFPDLICMLDPQNGAGIMSAHLFEGKDLFIIGVPCSDRLRSGLIKPSVAEAFSGARYGYPKIEFVPMEKLK